MAVGFTPLVALALLAAIAIYVMSPAERVRCVRVGLALVRRLIQEVRRRDRATDQFEAALQAEMPWTFCTLALVALNTTVFLFMLFSAGRFSETATLIAWGGNVGPRTANGEWWRLIASTLVHGGLFRLLVNMAVLLQIGLLLERVAGRVLFTSVYITAGIFANLSALAAYPMAVHVGASGAICGLFGLLLATWLWTLWYPPRRIPLGVLRRLAPAAAAFLLWTAVTGDMPLSGEFWGFLAGFVSGLVLTKRGYPGTPPGRRLVVGAVTAAALLILAFAIPLRGIADVRHDIARLITLEEQTAGAYQAAVERFKKGGVPTGTLTDTIVRTILPELQAADARLKAAGRVPPIHQALLTNAREYLRLRIESWQLRAEGLHKAETVAQPDPAHGGDPSAMSKARMRAQTEYRASLMTLAKSEVAERASLDIFRRIQGDANLSAYR